LILNLSSGQTAYPMPSYSVYKKTDVLIAKKTHEAKLHDTGSFQ